MHFRHLFLLSVTVICFALPVRATDAWAQFDQDAKRFCPSHHLEWLPDLWSDLPDEFERTLSPALRHRVASTADFRSCAREEMGFYCEGAVSMTAYSRIGILERFTHYACNRFVCTEGSICSDREHH